MGNFPSRLLASRLTRRQTSIIYVCVDPLTSRRRRRISRASNEPEKPRKCVLPAALNELSLSPLTLHANTTQYIHQLTYNQSQCKSNASMFPAVAQLDTKRGSRRDNWSQEANLHATNNESNLGSFRHMFCLRILYISSLASQHNRKR